MKFKKILYCFLWLVTIALIVTLLVYCNKWHQTLRCKGYNIEIDVLGKDTMLYKKDIAQILFRCSDSLVGKRFSKINMEKIEHALLKNKYVKSANVHSSLQGYMTLHVEQKRPVIRVISHENDNYYIDLQGNKIDSDRPAHVLVAHGFLDSDTLLQEVIELYKIIQQDDLLRVQIGDIYRSEKGIYQLSPVVGSHEIILGRVDNFAEGLSKLQLFYEKGIDASGWKEYKTIDLRFRDQIVCSKSKEKTDNNTIQ